MAYDGTEWNEGTPSDSTVANTIDDHMQDIKKGVRARLALEHIMPASQAATASGGRHVYVSFVQQTGAPSIAGNTAGVVWVGTDKTLNFTNSAGTDVVLVNTGAKIPVIAGGTLGGVALCSSANPAGITPLAGSADGYVLVTHSNTGAPTWADPNTLALTGFAARSYATSGTAVTDGLVYAQAAYVNTSSQTLLGFADTGNPASTTRASQKIYTYEPNSNMSVGLSLLFPVMKGEYWKVTGASAALCYFMPLGA